MVITWSAAVSGPAGVAEKNLWGSALAYPSRPGAHLIGAAKAQLLPHETTP